MVLKLILLQFCAHLMADFILQTQKWSNQKQTKLFSVYLLFHILVVGFFSWIFSLNWGFWMGALAIALLHFLTDTFKISLISRSNNHSFFFSDQLIHILSFIVVSVIYARFYEIQFIVDLELKWIAIFAGFLMCGKPSNIIIKYIFETFSIEIPQESIENDKEKSLPNAGRLIGISERFIALSFVLLGQFQAVGLLIAAKSILRLNSTQKSEYVLVGTLVSFGISVLLGILINII